MSTLSVKGYLRRREKEAMRRKKSGRLWLEPHKRIRPADQAYDVFAEQTTTPDRALKKGDSPWLCEGKNRK